VVENGDACRRGIRHGYVLPRSLLPRNQFRKSEAGDFLQTTAASTNSAGKVEKTFSANIWKMTRNVQIFLHKTSSRVPWEGVHPNTTNPPLLRLNSDTLSEKLSSMTGNAKELHNF